MFEIVFKTVYAHRKLFKLDIRTKAVGEWAATSAPASQLITYYCTENLPLLFDVCNFAKDAPNHTHATGINFIRASRTVKSVRGRNLLWNYFPAVPFNGRERAPPAHILTSVKTKNKEFMKYKKKKKKIERRSEKRKKDRRERKERDFNYN